MPAPRRAAGTARSRAGRRRPKARRARRRMRSSTACGRRSISCCRTRMPPSSPTSRRRWSRSWRRSARCRPCSRAASPSPPGAWRGRIASKTELFEERRVASGGLGLALIRDGNGARSFETLLRYRGAAMAEFWRALRTLKALQAEQALETDPVLAAHPIRPAARPPLVHRPQPNEPERAAGPDRNTLPSEPPASGPCTSPPSPGGRTNPRPCGMRRRCPRLKRTPSRTRARPDPEGESCANAECPDNPNEPDAALITGARRRICRAS